MSLEAGSWRLEAGGCRHGLLLLLALLAPLAALDIPAGLRETPADGFRVFSQCPDDDTARVAEELARVRGALAAWIGSHVHPLPPRLPPLPVLLFADREAFTAYARDHARNVATAHAEGFYSGDGTPGGGSLCLFHDGGRELHTARHELVHYLLDQILPAKAGQPVWFNEGLAVVAEDAWIDPGAVRPSAVPRQRNAILRRLAADHATSLAAITALGADGWLAAAGADRTAAENQYTASYGAVLYLLNSDPERYWDFLRRMAAGTDHDPAYAATLAAVPGGLDAAWRNWVAVGAWSAARAADPAASAATACEHGLAWLPENGMPGDPAKAARWLSAAARGFAQTPGYELDAASAWLAASRALDGTAPAEAGAAAEQAVALFAARGHRAGQAEAELAATRAWGDDGPGGDWNRAVAAGARAVQLADAVGPDELRAASCMAYGACFLAGRSTLVPAGSDRRGAARSALGRARDLHHAGGRPDGEATAQLLLAQALAPDDGRPGDWAGCLALAAAAEALWRTLPGEGHRADLAHALAVQASLLRPDRNPGGDWAQAAVRYDAEAGLIDDSDVPRRLRNQIDRAACRLGAGDRAGAAALFADAERLAVTSGDEGLAAYAAYQTGWAQQDGDPLAAAAAYRRSLPHYHALGKAREEAMAAGQAAQALHKAQAPAADIAAAYAAAAELERARGDDARAAYCLYQQAWFSEPSRQKGADPAAAAALYARSAAAWSADPAKAAQSLAQRARLLTPEQGARSGWDEATRAWAGLAAALAALPDAARHQGERGHALHQQAWCLIRGDGKRLNAEARQLFGEAVALQRAAGDEAGAKAAASWIK